MDSFGLHTALDNQRLAWPQRAKEEWIYNAGRKGTASPVGFIGL